MKQFICCVYILLLNIFRCEYERLHNIFKYTEDISIAKGLIYLKYLHDIVKRQVAAKITDDIPLNDIVYKVLINVVRNYKETQVVDKRTFSRLPQSHLEKIQQVYSFIIVKVVFILFDEILGFREYH